MTVHKLINDIYISKILYLLSQVFTEEGLPEADLADSIKFALMVDKLYDKIPEDLKKLSEDEKTR